MRSLVAVFLSIFLAIVAVGCVVPEAYRSTETGLSSASDTGAVPEVPSCGGPIDLSGLVMGEENESETTNVLIKFSICLNYDEYPFHGDATGYKYEIYSSGENDPFMVLERPFIADFDEQLATERNHHTFSIYNLYDITNERMIRGESLWLTENPNAGILDYPDGYWGTQDNPAIYVNYPYIGEVIDIRADFFEAY